MGIKFLRKALLFAQTPQMICVYLDRLPGSGKYQSYPEVDRAEFFPIELARRKIKDTQIPFLERLEAALKSMPGQEQVAGG